MAWISVHEQIIGKKLRSLSKAAGCSQNEAIGLLVRLWLWGIKNADRTGLLIDADRNDVAGVLADGLGADFAARDIVDAMVKTEWIDEEDDGMLFLHDWEDWQEYWYKKIDVREATKERVKKLRERRRKEKSEKKPEAKAAQVESPPDAEGKPVKKAARSRSEYTPDFEELWGIYPYKRGNKAKAARAYNARIADGWTKDQLIAATQRYGDYCMKERTPEQYVLHASTFLSPDLQFEKYLPRNMRPAQDGGVKQAAQNAGYGIGIPAMAPGGNGGYAPQVNDDDPYAGWR